MNLMDPYISLYHRLYIDNFYTSPKLLLDLLDKDTFACGTVRQNRKGLPSNIDKLERGEAVFKKHLSLTYVHWKDKRDVFCLSTFHGNTMSNFTTRRLDTRDIQRPDLVSSYNKYMGGVDHMDQMLSYYTIGKKTIKWYKRIFWRLIDMAIVNSFVLYNMCHPLKRMSHNVFRLQLADSLVTDWMNAKSLIVVSLGRRPLRSDNRLQGKHLATSSTKRSRCMVCGNKKQPNGKRRDKKTNIFREKCKVHLCLGKCFETYTKYRF